MAAEISIVARRIREVRESKKLSRQEIADRLNKLVDDDWTYLDVYRVETGGVVISADEALLFAGALECSVASLYRESRAAS